MDSVYNNMSLVSSGLKCDNPTCDWVDETIKIPEYKDWLNKPCPKCGENVLTEEDFENVKTMLLTASIINSMSPEQIAEMAKDVDLEELKNSEFLKDAKGRELLTMNEAETPITISFNTHKKVSINEIRKSDDTNDLKTK